MLVEKPERSFWDCDLEGYKCVCNNDCQHQFDSDFRLINVRAQLLRSFSLQIRTRTRILKPKMCHMPQRSMNDAISLDLPDQLVLFENIDDELLEYYESDQRWTNNGSETSYQTSNEDSDNSDDSDASGSGSSDSSDDNDDTDVNNNEDELITEILWSIILADPEFGDDLIIHRGLGAYSKPISLNVLDDDDDWNVYGLCELFSQVL